MNAADLFDRILSTDLHAPVLIQFPFTAIVFANDDIVGGSLLFATLMPVISRNDSGLVMGVLLLDC